MIYYKDRTYCYRDCGNTKCRLNKAKIDWKHVEEVGLPVAYRMIEYCEDYYDNRRNEILSEDYRRELRDERTD